MMDDEGRTFGTSSASGDLDACAREPIHVPGHIQPHGLLFVIEADSRVVLQASDNLAAFGLAADAPISGEGLKEIVGAEAARGIDTALDAFTPGEGPTLLGPVAIHGRVFDLVVHQIRDRLILELEAETADTPRGSLDGLYPHIQAFVGSLPALTDEEGLGSAAAAKIRELTGFDRVLVYRFDEDWNGTVVAEARGERLPSYLDLRFPASDIPAQARELYRLNRLRLIPDADYVPVPVRPERDPRTGALLDLSLSVLRSVSPVHVQYMKNMGTPASMSVSILDEGRLWGLISCHHGEPRRVPAHVRTACDFIGQILAMQIGAKARSRMTSERVKRHEIEARLLSAMSEASSFEEGLAAIPDELLALTDAAGAAIISEGDARLLGRTPSKAEVLAIGDWLFARHPAEGVFSTASLGRENAPFEKWASTAAGLAAIAISQVRPSFVIWFRPEVIETVRWGGDPRKPQEPSEGRLDPRTSFEMWKETVRGRSEAWSRPQIEAAASLRNAIVGIVMRKAEEMAALTEELKRSNKELEAFSYSISHDLRAPFRHIVGFGELLKEMDPVAGDARGSRYIDTVIESAHSAGRLVDDLLSFSQMGRAKLTPIRLDMNKLVDEVMRMLRPDWEGRDIKWVISSLPRAYGDPSFMRSVWQNLIANSIKYTNGTDPSEIVIEGEERDDACIYVIRDNGVGFDMAYVDKLFGVFQRLHRIEDYEGSGIGLANIRRIVERHGGKAWAEGEVGKGATFSFSLPKRSEGDTCQN